jgi:hypothetical protein
LADQIDLFHLSDFFKALADPRRLKILGVLAEAPRTVEQLAAILGLSASTASHHLSRLSRAGLVSARAEGYYSVYAFDDDAFQSMLARLASPGTLANAASQADRLGYDRKVLRDFFYPNGRLKAIPAQRKKLLVVLHRLVSSFEPGRQYWEREVNEILGRVHQDTATLRRELVGSGLLARDGGRYWRA